MHVSGEELETSADPYDNVLLLLLMPINVNLMHTRPVRTGQYTCKWLCVSVEYICLFWTAKRQKVLQSLAQTPNSLFA
jgi:hypothetical protein